MNNFVKIIILFVLFFTSCAQREGQDIILCCEKPDDVYFEFTNIGKSTAVFTISMDGMQLMSEDEINNTIDSLYGDSINKNEKVWRFVSEYTLHLDYIIGKSWLFDPVLLINSGGSLCGFRAAAMTNLLTRKGIFARSWDLNGHVITEVLNKGSWQVFDPDLGVVYRNAKGEIYSYDELCQNPSLITQPIAITSILDVCDSIQATSERTARKYSSTDDNVFFHSSSPEKIQDKQWVFTLPPGAVLSFPVSDTMTDNKKSLAVLRVPPKWTGKIQMPLYPYDHSQGATLFVGNGSPGASNEEWILFMSGIDEYDGNIDVKNNPNGLIIRFYINPIIYMPNPINNIHLEGMHASKVNVILRTRGKLKKPTTQSRCNEAFHYWDSLLNDCQFYDSLPVNSVNDYMQKVSLMQKCPCFSTIKLDTIAINLQLKNEVAKYEAANYFKFNKINSREAFLVSWVQFLQMKSHNY